MVLANRVAARDAIRGRLEKQDNRFAAYTIDTITGYAIDVVLGDDKDGSKLAMIKEYAEGDASDSVFVAAVVAYERIKDMGAAQ